VTLLAGLREVGGDVVGIVRALVILQMARHTGRAVQIVVVVNVAIRTLSRRDGMPTTQRKSTKRVIELCIEPVVNPMALVAGGGELACQVVGVGSDLVVLGVAGITLRRQALELSAGRALVAGIAIHSCMGAD